MAVFDVNGISISDVYDVSGIKLTQAYDIDGNELLGTIDYDEWETEYQHSILIARNAWQEEYRADNTVIPVIVHTDQHKYLNSAHKPTFNYLNLAIRWDEVTAIIGLGDVCGAVYNTTDLNNMVTCLSSLPKNKRIDIYGNHDCQLNKTEGSSYAYAPLTDELYHTLQDTYFDNSHFGSNDSTVKYGFKGNESMIDPVHHIKFCVFAVWVTRGDPWYKYYCDSDSIEAMISMLSTVDNYDIVILSHIQPYGEQTTWIAPAVDGNEQTTVEGKRAHIAYDDTSAIDQMIADRKAKRSGTITDCDGIEHSYDFTNCTSDLLCCLNGHSHADRIGYSPDGNVPSITFDAYRYDNVPMYFANIDRTKQRVNVWKFDEANNIYNFQVPFEEATAS